MAIRDIIIIPDPRLKLISEPVARITSDVKSLAEDMLETMYAAPGIGLAAIQLGIATRLVVLDVARANQPPEPLVLINPELLSVSADMRLYEEGCLSIPEVYAPVERPSACTIRYQTLDGNSIERDCNGLLATCVQHEIDHLNGIVFTDHLSRLKRERMLKKFSKLQRQNS